MFSPVLGDGLDDELADGPDLISGTAARPRHDLTKPTFLSLTVDHLYANGLGISPGHVAAISSGRLASSSAAGDRVDMSSRSAKVRDLAIQVAAFARSGRQSTRSRRPS